MGIGESGPMSIGNDGEFQPAEQPTQNTTRPPEERNIYFSQRYQFVRCQDLKGEDLQQAVEINSHVAEPSGLVYLPFFEESLILSF